MKTPVLMSLVFLAAGCTGAGPEGAVPQASNDLHLAAQNIPTLPAPDVVLQTAVTGFDGLAGNYVRVPYLAPEGELLSLSVDVYISEGGGAQGSFSRVENEICFYPGCNVDVGDFIATPQNPAIGFASFNFDVKNLDGTDTHDVYVVDGIARNKQGLITYLKLRHAVGNGLGSSFFLARTL